MHPQFNSPMFDPFWLAPATMAEAGRSSTVAAAATTQERRCCNDHGREIVEPGATPAGEED